MYQALYRKYRPKKFQNVVGQQMIVKTLQNSVLSNKFNHAYMFFGPRGTGKTTLSKIFARAINCENNNGGDACGICDKCINSYDKECVDIIEIDAASNNGVDEIRELKNKINLVPSVLKYKVYIIDEVHMLSIGAFNALLKTLEEPPEHVVFILATTDPQKVPETIISRCQCFSFEKISINNLVKRLRYICDEENIEICDDVLDEIANNSDGGLRDAIGMLDKLSSFTTSKIELNDFYEINGLITKNEIEQICNDIFLCNISDCLNLLEKFDDSGKNLSQILVQILFFLRKKLLNYYLENKSIEYKIDDVKNLMNEININLNEIRKSENPKVYIEMFIIDFIDNLNEKNILLDKNISNKKIVNKEKNNIIQGTEVIQNNNSKNSNKQTKVRNELNQQNPKIKNLSEILEIRLNNTFAEANKNLLVNEINNLKKLNDYVFDQQIGYIVSLILDAKFRMVSEENIVITYEHDSIVQQNLENLDAFTKVYNKITLSNKKFVILSDEKWNSEKNKYIESIKKEIKYKYIDEPEEIFEDIKNNDIISNVATDLFGDIVEYE